MRAEGQELGTPTRRRPESGQENLYRRIYNETPVMMHSIDDQARLVRVNDYWLEKLGYRRDEVLGRPATDFLTEESRRYAAEVTIPSFFETGYCEDIPYQMITKDGRILDVLLSATAEVDDQNRILSSRAMIVDVSAMRRAAEEREALLEELEGKNAELERFNYTVSHDLRSPLITISGFTELLEQHAENGDLGRMHEAAEHIRGAVGKMRRLLTELLQLSRSGQALHHLEPVDLSELARECVELMSIEIDGARCHVEIAPDLPTVSCDRTRMLEVFQNLIGNALRFFGDQSAPQIEIGYRQDGGDTVCFVRDNGIGIRPEDQKKIFQLFEQVAPEGGGTGIGLAVVQRIVEAHGGRIWVESAGLGSGSTFCFTIPKGTADLSPAEDPIVATEPDQS